MSLDGPESEFLGRMDGNAPKNIQTALKPSPENPKRRQMHRLSRSVAPHHPEKPEGSMQRSRKLLLTAAAVGTTSAVAGLGVFAAFTATTQNTGNSISSGTVAINDNVNNSQAYYVAPNRGPGSSTSSCIRVTYGGSLPATVKFYRSNTVTNGTAFNLRIERGSGLGTTPSFPSCTGFVAAADVYNGTLAGLATSWTGAPDARGSAWAQNDAVDYRITATVVDDPTPNAHSTTVSSGTHSLHFEAQNN